MDTLLEWYQRTMCNGGPIPDGVTINPTDWRADQSCVVCGEFVDAVGYPFSAERCSNHLVSQTLSNGVVIERAPEPGRVEFTRPK